MISEGKMDEIEAIEHRKESVGHLETTTGKPLGKDIDDALRFTLDCDGDEIEWTEEEERKVLRKIDMVILPLVIASSPCLNLPCRPRRLTDHDN